MGTVANALIFGGPPECITRITCLLGLQQIYGLHFKNFKPLDEVGPRSVAALASNDVQVVRLDSSDPAIPRHGWVILQDDKSFQQVGNIIPVIRTAKATDEVKALLDRVSAAMSQRDLFTLDSEIGMGHMTPFEAAARYVSNKNLPVGATTGVKEPITVGSAAFPENETLADIYAEMLKRAGYTVTAKVNIGNREKYEPELENGAIDILPEYVGNYLTFLDPRVNTVALAQAVSRLRELLAPKGLVALDPSSASDSDVVVVTKATADRFHLTTISELGHRVAG